MNGATKASNLRRIREQDGETGHDWIAIGLSGLAFAISIIVFIITVAT